MKTSVPETQQIDQYLLGEMEASDKLVFDARLLLYSELKETTEWQQKVHQLIHLRGKKALKREIHAVEQKLFGMPQYSSFRQRILQFFRPSER